jgi:ribosome recycling factor
VKLSAPWSPVKNMISEILSNADVKMGKTVEVLQRELATIRTGRASPALVEQIRVDYYGVPTPLGQMATISVPEARLLVIQPWDKGSLSSIEKAILKSDLGLNPANDGDVIRLSIPQLTEERRKELVRVVRKRVEEGRVAIRNVRRETMEQLRDLARNKEISEDEQKRALELLQKLTDRFIEESDRIARDKEAEVLEI